MCAVSVHSRARTGTDLGMLNAVFRVGLIAALFALGATSWRGDSTAPSARRVVAPADPATQVTYLVPVDGEVVVPFDEPSGPYAAGHRGVDFAAAQGTTAIAAAAGTVQFAGQVAGRGVVVLRHADGLLTEYEPVMPSVAAGEVVRSGDPIGAVAGSHRACAPVSCLHWGARRGDTYIDPMSLLMPLGEVRLLPIDGA